MNELHAHLARAQLAERLEEARELGRGRRIQAARRLSRRAERAAHQARLARPGRSDPHCPTHRVGIESSPACKPRRYHACRTSHPGRVAREAIIVAFRHLHEVDRARVGREKFRCALARNGR